MKKKVKIMVADNKKIVGSIDKRLMNRQILAVVTESTVADLKAIETLKLLNKSLRISHKLGILLHFGTV